MPCNVFIKYPSHSTDFLYTYPFISLSVFFTLTGWIPNMPLEAPCLYVPLFLHPGFGLASVNAIVAVTPFHALNKMTKKDEEEELFV